MVIHERSGDRLDDVMKMDGLTAGMGPQTDVDLLGLEQPIDNDRTEAKQWPLLVGLLGGQLSNTRDVSLGLEQKRADAQRSNTMLDPPSYGLVDKSAGE
jgi:hypothetical protein